MSRGVILVPRRAGIAERDRAWAWCRARWERLFPDWRVYEGHHDEGPFNRSAAINRAAKAADTDGAWDFAIVIDADIFIARRHVAKAVATAAATGKVTWAHRRWRGLSEDWTRRTLDDRTDFGPELESTDMDILVERTNPISWSCCIVIPRPVWDDLGGFDERFKGWGFEDMAFQSIVVGLYGHERVDEGDVYHLWHPRSEERIVKGQPGLTATPEYVTNARLGRRYMVAVRRDYGLHDRHTASDADEMVRDVDNLKRDDAKLSAYAKSLRLPDWDGWWPTLEELRAGAQAERDHGGDVTVTAIVRTGGEPDRWAERRGYLERSLASLEENVTGPIVQRVVYSDWGPERRDELAEIADRHGFYVAGEGHLGYGRAVARLWRYIGDRAKGSHVFLTEDDFIYSPGIDVGAMAATVRDHPHLRQLALLRQPCYPREMTEGTVLGWPADQFTDAGDRLEHRLFWTMNPSVFGRGIVRTAWPTRASSERLFGDTVLADPRARVAFWGSTTEPKVEHIGVVRAADAY